MRKSSLYITLTLGLAISLFGLLIIHPLFAQRHRERWAAEKQMVRDLGLTDICLFTEARYTRHLSQADFNAAFQDHPVSLEHFPSGSMVLPPSHLPSSSPEKVEITARPGISQTESVTRPGPRPLFTLAGQPLESEAADPAAKANTVQ